MQTTHYQQVHAPSLTQLQRVYAARLECFQVVRTKYAQLQLILFMHNNWLLALCHSSR